MYEKFTSWSAREMRRGLRAGFALLLSGALFGGSGLSSLPPIGSPSSQVVASWYGSAHEGRETASGAIFRRKALTAAHRTASFGTHLLVLYQNQMVEVLVNDRGPYTKRRGRYSRDLDLSEAAARSLGLIAAGVARVSVREIEYPAELILEQLLPVAPATVASLD